MFNDGSVPLEASRDVERGKEEESAPLKPATTVCTVPTVAELRTQFMQSTVGAEVAQAQTSVVQT